METYPPSSSAFPESIYSKFEKEEACRICLQTGSVSVYENKHFDTIDAVKLIAGIEISPSDPFPKVLCKKCYILLRGAVVFRKKAQDSDKELREHISIGNDVDDILKKYNLPEPSENIFKIQHSYDSDDDTKNTLLSEVKEKPEVPPKHKKVMCKECFCYISTKYYAGHMANHKGIMTSDGKVQCKICKRILTKKSFINHVTYMHGKRTNKYVCHQCGKTFLHSSTYQHHLTIHKTEFNYKCQLCDYRGASEIYLKYHMNNRHSAEPRYQCNECAARFMTSGNLSRHLFKHKGRNVKCKECDRTFYKQQEADQHYQVDHLGIRNHVCDICHKAFGYRSAMTKHQLKVHKRQKKCIGRTPSYLRAAQNENNQ